MAKGAPIGNKFWSIRSKHGRDKIFATPQIMWDAACEYFEWCDENPLYEIDFKGKDADRVELPKMRAYTLTGLCLYLHINSLYFNRFEEERKKENTEEAKDFCKVITSIRETLYTQKFTGAAAGFLNANLISRELGLVDKKQTEHSGEVVTSDISIADLPDELAQQVYAHRNRG